MMKAAAKSNRLPILAENANRAHVAAGEALRSALAHARAAGEALIEAKAAVPHGAWSAWLSQNFKGSTRTAERYIRIAKNWDRIAAKTTRMSDLSLREALELLGGSSETDRALDRARRLAEEADALAEEAKALVATLDDNPNSIEQARIVLRAREIFGRQSKILSTAERDARRIGCAGPTLDGLVATRSLFDDSVAVLGGSERSNS